MHLFIQLGQLKARLSLGFVVVSWIEIEFAERLDSLLALMAADVFFERGGDGSFPCFVASEALCSFD